MASRRRSKGILIYMANARAGYAFLHAATATATARARARATVAVGHRQRQLTFASGAQCHSPGYSLS